MGEDAESKKTNSSWSNDGAWGTITLKVGNLSREGH